MSPFPLVDRLGLLSFLHQLSQSRQLKEVAGSPWSSLLRAGHALLNAGNSGQLRVVADGLLAPM